MEDKSKNTNINFHMTTFPVTEQQPKRVEPSWFPILPSHVMLETNHD